MIQFEYYKDRKISGIKVVSKSRIRFKGKAQADRESRCSQHTNSMRAFIGGLQRSH